MYKVRILSGKHFENGKSYSPGKNGVFTSRNPLHNLFPEQYQEVEDNAPTPPPPPVVNTPEEEPKVTIENIVPEVVEEVVEEVAEEELPEKEAPKTKKPIAKKRGRPAKKRTSASKSIGKSPATTKIKTST